jgi:hypothetical protein
MAPGRTRTQEDSGEIGGWVKEVQDIADGNPNQNSISIAGDVLVFIHGYNNGLDIIMQRQRQLAKDLEAEGWKGIVIGFDWPTETRHSPIGRIALVPQVWLSNW